MTTKNLQAQRTSVTNQIEELLEGGIEVEVAAAVLAQAILTAADIIAAALDRQPA